MKKNILVFAILVALAFCWLPSKAEGLSSYARVNVSSNAAKGELKVQPRRGDRGFNRGHQKRYPRRYKNYGQYRRTQVGNRRSRTVRRYSWPSRRSSRRHRNY